MSLNTYIATARFRHAGRILEPGDEIRLGVESAAYHLRAGRLIVRPPAPKADAAAPEKKTKSKKRKDKEG